MYLRFVTLETNRRSHVAQGLFGSAYDLHDADHLEEHEAIWFKGVVGWFERNLKVPKRYDLDLRYDSKAYDKVVYWFRAEATEHVRAMREVATMLGHHGIPHRVLRTDKPGIIVYRDEHQVGAIPFRDGPK